MPPLDCAVQNVRTNYESWLAKALEMDCKEWRRAQPPDVDKHDCYKTELPHTLHQMVQQNIDVANTIRCMQHTCLHVLTHVYARVDACVSMCMHVSTHVPASELLLYLMDLKALKITKST